MTPLSRVGPASPTRRHDDSLHAAAEQLEATFVAEMLKSAGLGDSRDVFGGGAGEDQFASFLVQEQAKQIVRAGGLGLTEIIYHALREADDAR
ncbi:rod-binding protein [Sulfitobacter sp. LCG007]